ncbi:MAG TPA: Ig-like domain-containing protein, partial [Acidimicrobiales bacterium]|nr:Ig-like domain-containing protein [Acidimicrobiales bacterium]
MSGFLLMGAPGVAPAGAAPPQTSGDDVGVYQTGWTWTYNQTYTIDSPAPPGGNPEFFTLAESVHYTVAGVVSHTNYVCPASYTGGVCTSATAGATASGTYNTYQLNFTGTVTSGSGNADGQSLSVNTGSSSMSGTEWVEVGNLATVEVDQTQNISGTAAGLVTVTLQLINDEVYTPAQVVQDFRLHSGDTWLENTDVYDNGQVMYNAGSFGNGTDPIDSFGPIDTTATDVSTTASPPIASNTPVDQISYNDTANTTSETRTWSNTFHNVATDSYLQGVPLGSSCTSSATASCVATSMALVSSSTPSPALTVSESIGGLTNGVACGGETVPVSGALSTGSSGVSVHATLDQSTVTPSAGISQSTTTGTGGTYTVNFTAPVVADGLQKPGVNGSWPIEVSAGGASNNVTLEVGPQDCSATTYTGATSGLIGSAQTVSAQVIDIGTGQPVSGAVVTFSLNGTTVNATTGSNGVATTAMTIAGPVGTSTISASAAATPTETASSASSPFTVQLDPTATSLTASEPDASLGDPVTFTAHVSATGPTSGAITGTVTFSVDGSQLGSPVNVNAGGNATSIADNTMTLGNHVVTAVYSGAATYGTSTGTIPAYRVHPPLTPTSTTLQLSPNPSVFGQTVSLQATVVATPGTPDGAVSFFDGSTLLGTATLNGGSPDTAGITVSSFSVGNQALTASYAGDDEQFDSSNSPPINLNVLPSQTTTTITSEANPTVAGQGTTFDITVGPQAPGAGIPTGSVQVSVNGAPLGGPIALSGGTASVNDALGAGTYTVSAIYSGDGNFATSSGSTTQIVALDATTTSLLSNPNPSIQDQVVTFTATVSPNAPGGGNPTGLVTFSTDGGATTLGSANLSQTVSGAQASIQLANLPLGDTFVTATYGGDTNFTGSASQALDQSVQPAPPVVDTTTLLTTSQQPSVYGQSVSFTATVNQASGPNVPQGTVQFSVDGANIGAPVLLDANGVANSGAISSLAAGGHAVIAAYSGNETAGEFGFNPSGAVLTQRVQQAATAASGSPSANPDPFGQAETFSIQVAAVAPGAGTPSGLVQFSLDGSTLGTPVTLDANGDASVGPVNGLAPGAHTVSFVAEGDANFLGSNGSFSFTVSKIPTQTGLLLSPNPVVFGQPETMTATVTHTTGSGTPSGTVTFSDGSTTLAIIAVTGGGGSATASFTTTTLSAGPHVITATFSGDTNF